MHAKDRGDAFERGPSGKPHHQKHHPGLEVARAHPDECFIATTRRQDHARTKHEATQGVREPKPFGRCIQGLGGVDGTQAREE